MNNDLLFRIPQKGNKCFNNKFSLKLSLETKALAG